MQFTVRELHDLSLMAIMDRWPQTLSVFIKHQMLCIGCTIAPYHIIKDACREHDLDEDKVVVELIAAIKSGQ